MYTVSIIDQNRFTRHGFRLLLANSSSLIPGNTYASLKQALQDPDFENSDVVLISAKLTGTDVTSSIRTIIQNHPTVLPLVIFSAENEEAIVQAILAGAVGFVERSVSSQELIQTLELICQGGSPITPAIAQKLLDPAYHYISFTSQEKAILKLIAEGRSYRSVANSENVTQTQLFKTIRNIYQKLQKETKKVRK